MENEYQTTIYDKILRSVYDHKYIKLADLSREIQDDKLESAIYELLFLDMLGLNGKDIYRNEFFIPSLIESAIKSGVPYERIRQKLAGWNKHALQKMLWFFLIMIVSLALVIFFFGLNSNSMVAFMVIAVSFMVFDLSRGSRHSARLKVLSILILLHLLVFPIFYVFMLRSDPTSLAIDGEVKALAVKSARTEAVKDFEPSKLSLANRSINLMLASKSKTLKELTTKLDAFDIVKIDTFLLYKSFIPIDETMNPSAGSHINICNSSGSRLVTVEGIERMSMKLSEQTITLEKLLSLMKMQLENKMNLYVKQSKSISQNRFWTYLRVLPHSLNIFDVGNIVPKSEIANIVYLIHKILFTLLVALIALSDFIGEKLRQASSN